MTRERKEIISEILQLIGFVVFLVFLYFAVCPAMVHGENKKKWVCWVNSVKDNSCGTYGWSNSKSIAIDVAQKKCEDHCESECKLEYCERIK